ncbi:hypothetical protein E2I00_011650 [Balaenoptera physalus]|uniref:Uncharacterized protein n=1 Tax=Balaenoptera physalus TaxID=9770 RepID=A0A6A1QH41_BALPH|nr:hypothetical protein E2I00_011650 [Balaenoptera physalus]
MSFSCHFGSVATFFFMTLSLQVIMSGIIAEHLDTRELIQKTHSFHGFMNWTHNLLRTTCLEGMTRKDVLDFIIGGLSRDKIKDHF